MYVSIFLAERKMWILDSDQCLRQYALKRKRLCQHEMEVLKYFIILSRFFLIRCYHLLTITLHVHLTKNGVVAFKWQYF